MVFGNHGPQVMVSYPKRLLSIFATHIHLRKNTYKMQRSVKKPLSLIIFDLDGTLVDTKDDLRNAVNYALGFYNAPLCSTEMVVNAIGNGARKLIERCLPPNQHQNVDSALEHLLYYYKNHTTEHTTPCVGLADFLELTHKIPKAVLTNKPLEPTLQILEFFNWSKLFYPVIGGDSFDSKKPDPEGLNFILNTLQVPANQALLIGDGVPDIQVAKSVGVPVVALLNGFDKPEDLLHEGPDYACNSLFELADSDFLKEYAL
jgi:phosphoglycolate phosphatase